MTTTIVKPTWSVDGWTGNTIDDSGTHWFARRDAGWFGPVGVRASSSDRPAGDGSYTGTNRRASRVITLEGFCQSLTTQLADDALHQFNALLADGELHQLVVEDNHRVLTALVRLADGTNIERITPRRSDWQLVLVAPDPRKYGSATRTSNTGLATAAPGGVPWNGAAGLGLPWNGTAGNTGVAWQSGVGSSGVVTATNAGNAAAPVTLIITAAAESVVNPRIVDIASQKVVAYTGTVPAGSVLVIDTDTGTVLLDGANRGPLARVDPITVPRHGQAALEFTAASPAPSASLQVQVRDTYI